MTMDKANVKFVSELLLIDPFSGDELRPTETYPSDEGFVMIMETEDGSRKWRHIILTEEI